VCIHVFDILAERVMHRFGCFGFQDQGIAPGVNSVTVPKLSVVVVVVLVTPFGCLATLVEDVVVCANTTKPIRSVANAIRIT
jgi:hypothetical protein